MFIVTANPEIFMTAYQNQEFDKILQSDNISIVPDGIGIVKAMQIMGIDVKERITGVELCSHLLEIANQTNKSIFFFGSKPEVLELLCKKVKDGYPNIIILGSKDGYDPDKDKTFDEIQKCAPDIVLVALGVPAQELLISRHIDKFDKGIFIGVGGSFDVLSGAKKRAPKIFINLNLEWLYRILKEPTRIKRFYKSNVKFFSVVRKSKKQEIKR